MFKAWLRSIFAKSPVAGEIFVLDNSEDSTNPFKKPPPRIKVIAVRDRWVNYKFCDSSMWQNESMCLASFLYCYKRMT